MSESTPILITGATGMVGRSLIRKLHGLDPTMPIRVMTRNPDSVDRVGDIPVHCFGWSRAPGGLEEALSGVGQVVHLAGEPVAQRWRPEARARILNSRIDTLDMLRRQCRDMGLAPRLISASAVGGYPEGPEPRMETDLLGQGFLADVVREWESAAERFGALGGGEVRLRIGLALSPEGGVLQRLMPLYTMGLGAPLAPGHQWQSWIVLDDLVDLFVTAIGDGRWHGAYNATAPHPVEQREFSKTLARIMGRPHFLPPVPAWALKLRFGEAADALLASHRILPGRAQDQGFEFRHPELEGGLQFLLGS